MPAQRVRPSPAATPRAAPAAATAATVGRAGGPAHHQQEGVGHQLVARQPPRLHLLFDHLAQAGGAGMVRGGCRGWSGGVRGVRAEPERESGDFSLDRLTQHRGCSVGMPAGAWLAGAERELGTQPLEAGARRGAQSGGRRRPGQAAGAPSQPPAHLADDVVLGLLLLGGHLGRRQEQGRSRAGQGRVGSGAEGGGRRAGTESSQGRARRSPSGAHARQGAPPVHTQPAPSRPPTRPFM